MNGPCNYEGNLIFLRRIYGEKNRQIFVSDVLDTVMSVSVKVDALTGQVTVVCKGAALGILGGFTVSEKGIHQVYFMKKDN